MTVDNRQKNERSKVEIRIPAGKHEVLFIISKEKQDSEVVNETPILFEFIHKYIF